MILAAGTPPECGATRGVRCGDPGEDGERRCNTREREDLVVRLVENEIGDDEE